jgi:hypothetical protein
MSIRGLMAFLACSALLACTGASPASAAFGVSSFDANFEDLAGNPANQAGGHPDLAVRLDFNTKTGADGTPLPEGQVRDLEVRLPTGLSGNSSKIPACKLSQLVLGGGLCNPAAQVGVLRIPGTPGAAPADFPVYNMVASAEQASVLAIIAFGIPTRIVLSALADRNYGITADLSEINQGMPLGNTRLVLWGVPADPIHDLLRFEDCALKQCAGHPAGTEPTPFLSLPTRCEPLTIDMRANSWQNPGSWIGASDELPPLTGCERLDFAPSLAARPTTAAADSPAGLDVTLELPQSEDPEGLASAHLRRMEVTLPPGLVLNPSTANGLAACGPAQIGLTTAVGIGRASFTNQSPSCPDASKTGTVEVKTPLLPDPLRGSVFVAIPTRNPFGSLLAIYMVLEGHGLVVKLAGKVTPDPRTGRLRAVFEESPQLSFESLRMSLFGGARAPLRTPGSCGDYTAAVLMTAWSAPATPSVSSKDEFTVARASHGGACAAPASAPSFEAGSVVPLAGVDKPFVVNLGREDGTQQFSSLTFSPPPGLVAKLAGAATCSEAALAAAATRTGREEQASPGCPDAAAVGSVYLAAGAGPLPYNVAGKVYLSGPYEGAPLSLTAIVPALAGPFDLGNIVLRVAMFVDPRTARITAVSDPIPSILEGVPLDLRSLSIRLDKPGFTRNPTSCDPMSVQGTVDSAQGAATAVSSRFQLAECGRLAFRPKLGMKLIGPTARSAHPGLRATLTMPPGGANLAELALTLPRTQLLAASHVRAVCGTREFNQGNCPPGSIYGHAVANSPLLAQPLRGPVYLRANAGRRLPDLVASLQGQIHLDVVGRIDSPRGRIRTSFETADLPLRRFALTLGGGDHGLVVNTGGVCATSAPRAEIVFAGHNGRTKSSSPRLRANCAAGRPGAR